MNQIDNTVNDTFEVGDNVRIYNEKGRYTGPGLVLGCDEENRVMVQHFTTIKKHIDVFPSSRLQKIKF